MLDEEDKVVVDSNVIAAIFFLEEASEKAQKIAQKFGFITVDYAIIEIANVAWKRVMVFGEPMETIISSLEKCLNFIKTTCEVIPHETLIMNAFKIALEDEITIYDALYIATSEMMKIHLITLDKNLYMKVKDKRAVSLIDEKTN